MDKTPVLEISTTDFRTEEICPVDSAMNDLSDLQLAIIGGGAGDTIWA